MLHIIPVTTKAQRKHFVRFAWRVYRGAQPDPLWVPPMLFERDQFFDPNKGAFYDHATVQLFLAMRGDQIVGTISAHINHLHNQTHHENIGFFGFFEVLDDPVAAQLLLQTACEWVRDHGCTAIRGPMNFSINDECGLLIDGFDSPPVAMMTYNPPRYSDYIEQAGFGKVMDLYAWMIDQRDFLDDSDSHSRIAKVRRVAEMVQKQTDIKFRTVNMQDFANEVERAWQIYNAAWAQNWGAIPMTRAEFQHLADSFKFFLDPNIMLFACIGDKPIGLLIAIPDMNIPLRSMNGRLLPFGWFKVWRSKRTIDQMRVIIMGVLPEYRRRGIDALFYYHIGTISGRLGYRTAEMSWILETNHMMNNTIAMLGGKHYKTYRVYEKNLG